LFSLQQHGYNLEDRMHSPIEMMGSDGLLWQKHFAKSSTKITFILDPEAYYLYSVPTADKLENKTKLMRN
jgi:lipopolysaccharide assembly outer membrane protein LptD (OstA)